MDLEKLRLVYVGSVGVIDDCPVCNFYFSTEPESAFGPGWTAPCADEVEPPYEEYVSAVFRLTGAQQLVLTLLEHDYEHRYFDGVFGALPLAWEKIDYDQADLEDQLDARGKNMLQLRYGDSFAEVSTKLAQHQGELTRIELAQAGDPASTDFEDEQEELPDPEEEDEYPLDLE